MRRSIVFAEHYFSCLAARSLAGGGDAQNLNISYVRLGSHRSKKENVRIYNKKNCGAKNFSNVNLTKKKFFKFWTLFSRQSFVYYLVDKFQIFLGNF